MSRMLMFDENDDDLEGICSDCKRCYDMSFYHSWKGCCMIWQSLEEHPEQMTGGING